jgi:Tol biopolymer transport system component
MLSFKNSHFLPGILTGLCLLRVTAPALAASGSNAGWIVAAADGLKPTGAPSLIAISPDGRQRRLLKREFSSFEWDIDRAGSKVCFTARPGDREFFSARSARNYLFQLLANEPKVRFLLGVYERDLNDELEYQNPSWTWDGSKIVLSRGIPDFYTDDYGISTVDLRTLTVQNLTSDPPKDFAPLINKREISPQLSPDGKSLLFVSTTKVNGGTDAGLMEKDWNYYLIYLDLQNRKFKLLAVDDSIGNLSWCPDGRAYAYCSVSRTEKAFRSRLCIGDLKSSRIVQWPDPDPGHGLEWSPDGHHVVYTSFRPVWRKGKQLPRMSRLFIADRDGKHIRCLASDLKVTTHFRWTAALADWSKYNTIPVMPLVGPAHTPTPTPTKTP